ncbi:MAG: DUF3575 domain-containing protein [Bacteroidales bacterium]|nr:DUF3575 domain-containing protein [Bacteroidales bacterium]
MKKLIIILPLLLFMAFSSHAQNASVSTNIIGYADFLTINAEGSYGFARHWTANAGFQFNPWSFKGDWGEARNDRRSVYAGARYWLWNIYSGWWFGGKLQWEEYNRGGFKYPETEEGDAYGVGAATGYSLMLHRNINLDFGLGLWGGYKKYTVYRCPTCGKIEEQGEKAFIMPNDFQLSLVFTF